MQINRLIEIVYMLLSKNNITAKELSERLNVSVRTIYRDVEALSASGIPVYMNRGKGGGIGLLDNFVLNRSMLSEKEQNDILMALSAVSSLSPKEEENVLAKLSGLFRKESQDWIKVNFFNWHGFDMKFETIKDAIISKKVLEFDYYGKGRERTSRRVEPLQLQFNARAWYLYAFCLNRDETRIFKISRMENVCATELNAGKAVRDFPVPVSDVNLPEVTRIVLKLDESQAYRIFDEFSDGETKRCDDGSFIITIFYPEDEWVYGYIMSFGHYVEVLEPVSIREIIACRMKKALSKYL